MSIPDPYKTLQVDPEAEDEVIEAAYRRLARKYHPDVAQGPDSQDRMVRINQAWEMLRDPVQRAAVDRARARSSAAAARVGAADAPARGPAGGRSPADGHHAPTAGEPDGGHGGGRHGGPEETRAGAAGPAPGWPLPGMRDPSDDESAAARPERVSRDWTSGRSTTGSTYDPSVMRAPEGHGAAGPPPGRPSGSVLNFGRYAGWSLGEVARSDVEYIEWLDRMPIGRMYQQEIDLLLRAAGRRSSSPAEERDKRGLFRRR